MKIGIDISQLAYQQTGVANYLQKLVENMILQDNGNDYVLFFSSFRRSLPSTTFWDEHGEILINNFKTKAQSITIKQFKFPPTALNILWNKLHKIPIETFTGPLDIFISSDWTEPPTRHAKKVTVIYDLIIYKFPEETDATILAAQKRKLQWAKKECDAVLCISEATKKDVIELLKIDSQKVHVIYPGL